MMLQSQLGHFSPYCWCWVIDESSTTDIMNFHLFIQQENCMKVW